MSKNCCTKPTEITGGSIALTGSTWSPCNNIATMRLVSDDRATGEAKYSGSFDWFNPKTNHVETVYIKEIIYNEPATIVLWSDGSKTVSKARPGDEYNPEVGVMYCILKKLAPNTHFDTLFDDWLPYQLPILPEAYHVTLKDVRNLYKFIDKNGR